MMIKYARAQGTDIIEVVEPGAKLASHHESAARAFISGLEPDPRYTYALVNSMGYSEFYGANSNTDWYGYNKHLDFNGLLNAWDGIGEDIEVDRMRGKKWPYGYPCFYEATCFAHHKNQDAQKFGFGDVIYTYANPHMKRVELVMRVFNEEAAKRGHTNFLDRMRAGERVDVSMGCKVPFDLCSICTDWDKVHKAWGTYSKEKHLHPGIAILYYHRNVSPIRGLAVTSKDYCECMRMRRGKILPDGRKIFVFNDFPRFFDISFVWVGADRTARVMWFLSPEGSTAAATPSSSKGPNLEEVFRRILSKVASKSAEHTKEVPDGFIEAVNEDAVCGPAIPGAALRQLTGEVGPSTLLSSLAALGIVLSPAEFQNVALVGSPDGEELAEGLEKRSLVFKETGGVSDRLKVSSGFVDLPLAEKLAAYAPLRSGFDPFLTRRLLSVHPKVASELPREIVSDRLSDLGSEYNGYRLSLLDSAEELAGQGALALPFMSSQKSAGFGGVAGLLLGLGPVIHFVSSHLRDARKGGKQMGGLASFVADNPTFSTMATIGAALRAVMMVDQAGGMGTVVKAISSAASKLF
jgi:hypothetical protein